MHKPANGIAMSENEHILNVLKDHLEGTTGHISKDKIDEIYNALTSKPSQLPYEDFLRRKIKVAENYGFDVDPDDINPICKPHQRDIIVWTLQGGRRAVFASFGLGKTVIQLETGYFLHKKTNKPIHCKAEEYKQLTPTLFDVLEMEEA